MKDETQFTVFLENKPGRLSRVCNALAKEKVNIQAMTVMDSKEHSVLRFVPDDAARARAALKKLGADSFEATVTAIELKHQPGAVASVCERLAAEHVNVDYLYCSTGSKNGRTVAIFKATPAEKVRSALAERPKPKARVAPRRPARWR